MGVFRSVTSSGVVINLNPVKMDFKISFKVKLSCISVNCNKQDSTDFSRDKVVFLRKLQKIAERSDPKLSHRL